MGANKISNVYLFDILMAPISSTEFVILGGEIKHINRRKIYKYGTYINTTNNKRKGINNITKGFHTSTN